jgi:hypothetical protein
MKRTFLLVTVLGLAACGKPDAVAKDANNVDGLPTLNKTEPSPTGAPPAGAAAPASASPTAAASIPAAVQGRWGLTPRDCTSDLGDAKGLLVINSSELRFYESRAAPGADVETSTDSVSGTFNFSGEGQTWSRYEALEVDGSKMKRTERDPLVTFNYARCG